MAAALRTGLAATTAVAALVSSIPAGGTAASGWPAQADVLKFIGGLEAPSGYDQVHSSVPEVPPHPVTRMALRDVMAWQKRIQPRATSTAAGRYQIIQATLARLVEEYGIDPEQLFDAGMQDRLGGLLLTECGYGVRSKSAFANCLAGTWAALPRVSGPNAGRSVWDGIAGNRALVGPAAVMAFLEGREPSTGTVSTPALSTITLPRSSIRYETFRSAIEREMKEAHDNGDLGRSVVVRFTVDPYRTE